MTTVELEVYIYQKYGIRTKVNFNNEDNNFIIQVDTLFAIQVMMKSMRDTAYEIKAFLVNKDKEQLQYFQLLISKEDIEKE